MITNGNSAVQLFFVLSGFLISRKIYRWGKDALSNPIKVYLKLLRIVIPATLLSVILMATGAMVHLKVSSIYPEISFVNSYNNNTVSLINILFNVFIKSFIKGNDYVAPLWTIRYEFWGSILVAAFSLYGCANPKYSKIFYISLMGLFALLLPNITSFIIGAFTWDCLNNTNIETSKKGIINIVIERIIDLVKSNLLFRVVFFLISLYFASVSLDLLGIYYPFHFLSLYGIDMCIFRAIGISGILILICTGNRVKAFLSIDVLKKLGEISGYIYAFHWPIVLSLGCGVYMMMRNMGIFQIGAGIAASIVVIIISVCGAYFYTNTIDKYYNTILERITKTTNKTNKKNV